MNEWMDEKSQSKKSVGGIINLRLQTKKRRRKRTERGEEKNELH